MISGQQHLLTISDIMMKLCWKHLKGCWQLIEKSCCHVHPLKSSVMLLVCGNVILKCINHHYNSSFCFLCKPHGYFLTLILYFCFRSAGRYHKSWLLHLWCAERCDVVGTLTSTVQKKLILLMGFTSFLADHHWYLALDYYDYVYKPKQSLKLEV